MRKWIVGLVAISAPALSTLPQSAAAQQTSVVIGGAPGGFGFMAGPMGYPWGPYAYDYDDPYFEGAPGASYYGPPAMSYYGPPRQTLGPRFRGYRPPATGTAPPPAPVERAGGPGQCGTFFYWSDGRCVDARNRSAN